MKKNIFLVLFLFVFSLSFVQPALADDASSGEVIRKLDEIAKTQAQIMESLEQVKAELKIIKVRASND